MGDRPHRIQPDQELGGSAPAAQPLWARIGEVHDAAGQAAPATPGAILPQFKNEYHFLLMLRMTLINKTQVRAGTVTDRSL